MHGDSMEGVLMPVNVCQVWVGVCSAACGGSVRG